MNEAFSESAEYKQRPELDRNTPAELFLYARDKQRWVNERVSERQRPGVIDHLVDELDRYITTGFDGLPELTITSSDIYYTRAIDGHGSRHVIESGSLPLSGDAQLLGEHEVKGLLYGFHRGEAQDLRVYVSNNDGVRHFMGGIYTPLLSVGIENSTIHLSEFTTAEKLRELSGYVKEQLGDDNEQLIPLAQRLIENLSDPKALATKKLHSNSAIVAEIARHPNSTPQLMDAFMEIIKLSLQLDEPQDIQTQLHRQVITKQPIAAYKAQPGPTHFSRVEDIQLGLIGETANKGLGLFFMKDEQAVQIPVQYITSIYRSAR